jgi:hypothetical protein
LIGRIFFCGVPVVLAMLSALLGPYAAIMRAAGAAEVPGRAENPDLVSVC